MGTNSGPLAPWPSAGFPGYDQESNLLTVAKRVCFGIEFDNSTVGASPVRTLADCTFGRADSAKRKVIKMRNTTTIVAALIGAGACGLGLLAYAQTVPADGTGFAGAYAPSKIWQPPKDPLALEKLKKFQDLKFGFFCCWGTQTQWETIDQSWSLCPERYDWNKRPGVHANDDTLTYKKAYEGLMQDLQSREVRSGDRWRRLPKRQGLATWCSAQSTTMASASGTPRRRTTRSPPRIALTTSTRTPMSPASSSMPSAREGSGSALTFPRPDWNVPYYWAPQFGPPTSRNPNYSPPPASGSVGEIQGLHLVADPGTDERLRPGGHPLARRRPGAARQRPGYRHAGDSLAWRGTQPGLLVVDRTAGGGCEDYLTPEGTHAMPEQFMPEAWEACMTLGDWWGWSKGSTYHSSGEHHPLSRQGRGPQRQPAAGRRPRRQWRA